MTQIIRKFYAEGRERDKESGRENEKGKKKRNKRGRKGEDMALKDRQGQGMRK